MLFQELHFQETSLLQDVFSIFILTVLGLKGPPSLERRRIGKVKDGEEDGEKRRPGVTRSPRKCVLGICPPWTAVETKLNDKIMKENNKRELCLRELEGTYSSFLFSFIMILSFISSVSTAVKGQIKDVMSLRKEESQIKR
jgi:hypothetical protein